MNKYCSLHQHSDASFLDCINKPEALAKRAAEIGMPAIALSDHGNTHNFIKMFEACKKEGVKFIPGIEIYFTHKHEDKERKSRHLTLIAQNNIGLSNLYRLVSISNLPVDQGGGFFYRNRNDWDDLAKYSEGIICLTGCMNSPSNHEFQKDDFDLGKKYVKRLMEIFSPKRLFVELQNVNEDNVIYIPEQELILQHCRRVAKELDLRCVATNDGHYLLKSDAFAHEILKAIASGATLKDPTIDQTKEGERGRMVFSGFDYYVRSDDEMRKKFSAEEVEMSNKIADMIDVDIPLKQDHMPRYSQDMNDQEVYDLLVQKCREGWKRLNINDCPNPDAYLERIKVELKDIKDANNQHYFMIVHDVIHFAAERGIQRGFGRGSVGGSLVAYLLGITQGVDPIKYGLIWERFWNRGRVGSPPDIDLDFPIESREEIIDYIREKFGKDRVIPMMTLSTMKTKAVLKDVGKVLGLPFEYTNELTDHIPHKCKSIQDAVERSRYIADCEKGIDNDVREWKKQLKSADPNTQCKLQDQITERSRQLVQTFENARKLENIYRQRSGHACALLISDEDIDGKIPLCWDAANKRVVTGFDMYDLENMGYMKLDILGLKTLTVINKVLERGIQEVIDHGFDDPAVYDLISTGDTKGIFQLEEHLGRTYSKRIKPRNIEELAAVTSIIRPAVLEAKLDEEYIDNRNEGQWAYIHDKLKPILDSTFGVMLYQEQAIQIARDFAGFSLERADNMRKVFGKKLEDEVEQFRNEFIEGTEKQLNNKKLGEELWSWLEHGAGYGFNKSHAIAYGMMAYATAYCKKYYPEKFFRAMLEHSDKAKRKPHEEISELYYDAKVFGVKIKPPCLSQKNKRFEIINNEIVYGLQHIKSIGASTINKLLKANINSWQDLYESKGVLKKDSLHALILSGALDFLNIPRHVLQHRFEFMEGLTTKEAGFFDALLNGEEFDFNDKKSYKAPQNPQNFDEAVQALIDFLDGENVDLKGVNKRRSPKLRMICDSYLSQQQPFTDREIMAYETQYLGINISSGGVNIYNDTRKTHHMIEIKKEMDQKGISTVAIINNINERVDRNKNPMAFVTVSDNTFQMDFIMFNRAYKRYSGTLKEGRLAFIEGVKRRGSVLIDSIELL